MKTQEIKKVQTGPALLIAFLACTSIYFARINLSILSPSLIDGGFATTAQIGLLGSVFSIVCAIGKLINGNINDKAHPKIMLTVGLFSVGISNILSGLFPPFLVLAVLWGINAYAQSSFWGAVLRFLSSNYEPGAAKKRINLTSLCPAIGNILAILLNTWLIVNFGAQYAYYIPGLLNLVLAPFAFIFMSNINLIDKPAKEHISPISLLKSPKIYLMIVPAMVYGILNENVTLWMTSFFVYSCGIDLTQTSFFLFIIPTVGLIIRSIYPLIHKAAGENELRVGLWAFALCIVSAVSLCFVSNSPILAALFLGLCYASASMLNISVIGHYPIRFTETGNVSSACGILDFSAYMGAGIASAAYGLLINNNGYNLMFISWAIISVFAGISIFRCSKISAEE